MGHTHRVTQNTQWNIIKYGRACSHAITVSLTLPSFGMHENILFLVKGELLSKIFLIVTDAKVVELVQLP